VLLVLLAATAACALLPMSARATVAQSWNPAIAVSPADEIAGEPRAAIDAHGDLAVVWENHTSAYHTTILLSRKLAGGSFSAPVTIGEAPGQNQSPAIALGPEGQLVVLWQTDADTEYEVRELVMASTGSIAGGQFSAPEAISGYEGGNGFMHPRVAIADNGETIAMWRGLDERTHYTERAPSGAHFAQPKTINGQGTLVFSPDGTALAAWGEGEGLAAHLVAAVKQPGMPFGPAETIETSACGELHAAINDAGDAVVDWTTTKQCESGGEPVWLRASYRPAGGHFGAPVDAAEMGGWSQAGGVAVSPKGRVELSAKGWMTNPAHPGYVTALTRLPDGSYGAPETISNQELLESPPVLAFDAEENFYAAAETRDWWGGLESGILANVAPAAGTFAAESQWLQTLQDEYENPPSLVAAGEGQAAAVWLAGEQRVELATLASAEGAPPQDPPPAPPPTSSAPPTPSSGAGSVTGGATAASAEGTPSQGQAPPPAGSAAANPSGGVAGSASERAAAQPRHLTVTGRVGGARSILVRLIRGGQVVRSSKARLAKDGFRALLSLDGLRPGDYQIEILRHGSGRHRAAYRPFELTGVVADR
jgi:hypothetical protein